jgi:hypothetical protein
MRLSVPVNICLFLGLKDAGKGNFNGQHIDLLVSKDSAATLFQGTVQLTSRNEVTKLKMLAAGQPVRVSVWRSGEAPTPD